MSPSDDLRNCAGCAAIFHDPDQRFIDAMTEYLARDLVK